MRELVAAGLIGLALVWPGNLGLLAQEPGVDRWSDWTVFILNDTCPDYTWGNSEAQTRDNFAELVRSQLDEMTRTDAQPEHNRHRYNAAATVEVQCFLEKYPQRQAELARRIREGRFYVSPFLCNTLWGWQSAEGLLRSLYPARRLERDWGLPKIEVAHHIECPSLPWGMAPLLSGAGLRWVNVPFLDYDCTFGRLTNPPVFVLEGPDGSRLGVILDAFASRKANYVQGAHLLDRPQELTNAWLPHYSRLGQVYPIRAVLASGTHGDTHAHSTKLTRSFVDKIIAFNASSPPLPRLVNAILPQFCTVIDQAQARRRFLPTFRGDFGHSWELWPVSLARLAAEARENERRFLAAETLLTVASLSQPRLVEWTRADRQQAEWYWAMLADHAWNGSDDPNRRENARLRRVWNHEFARLTSRLLAAGWTGLGVRPGQDSCVVFNCLSVPRSDLVRLPVSQSVAEVRAGRQSLPCQMVREQGQTVLYFVSPTIPGFGVAELRLRWGQSQAGPAHTLRASSTELESPFYRLVVDQASGGLSSLVHKPTGAELRAPNTSRTVGQTIFYDGREHTLTNVQTAVVALGPVLARLSVIGQVGELRVTNFITVYAALDRVDFDFHICKPVQTTEHRLCQVFPVTAPGSMLRVETPGAVIIPEFQPAGDLLAGADRRRLAVQGFVDVSSAQTAGVTVAPLDAFALRRDLGDVTFESLGNDQNYKEVSRDQGGDTHFRFRYVLRAHGPGYDNAATVVWSRTVGFPLLAALGDNALLQTVQGLPTIDPARALATAFKPADDPEQGGYLLRLWEIGGRSGPLGIHARTFKQAWRTDLLERDTDRLPIKGGELQLPLAAYGFAAVRLRQ